MTNMSSMPMPRQRKGNIECIGVYGKPRSELNIFYRITYWQIYVV